MAAKWFYLRLHKKASRLEIGFPGGIPAGLYSESIRICSPAGRKPAGGTILKLVRQESGQHPARKPDFWSGSTIAEHRVVERPSSEFCGMVDGRDMVELWVTQCNFRAGNQASGRDVGRILLEKAAGRRVNFDTLHSRIRAISGPKTDVEKPSSES